MKKKPDETKSPESADKRPIPQEQEQLGKKSFGPKAGQAHRFGVDELARRTGTDRIVAAALKTAYGWDENTLLSADEYERSRNVWLAEKK